jgi:hypothetical protein
MVQTSLAVQPAPSDEEVLTGSLQLLSDVIASPELNDPQLLVVARTVITKIADCLRMLTSDQFSAFSVARFFSEVDRIMDENPGLPGSLERKIALAYSSETVLRQTLAFTRRLANVVPEVLDAPTVPAAPIPPALAPAPPVRRGPGRPRGSGGSERKGGGRGGSGGKDDKPARRRPLEDPSDIETDADRKKDPAVIEELALPFVGTYKDILQVHNLGSDSPFDMSTFTKMAALGKIDPVLANKLKYLPLVLLAIDMGPLNLRDEAAFLNEVRRFMRMKNYRLALAKAFCEAFGLDPEKKLGSIESALAYLAPKLRPADWWDRIREFTYWGDSSLSSPNEGEAEDGRPDEGGASDGGPNEEEAGSDEASRDWTFEEEGAAGVDKEPTGEKGGGKKGGGEVAEE